MLLQNTALGSTYYRPPHVMKDRNPKFCGADALRSSCKAPLSHTIFVNASKWTRKERKLAKDARVLSASGYFTGSTLCTSYIDSVRMVGSVLSWKSGQGCAEHTSTMSMRDRIEIDFERSDPGLDAPLRPRARPSAANTLARARHRLNMATTDHIHEFFTSVSTDPLSGR